MIKSVTGNFFALCLACCMFSFSGFATVTVTTAVGTGISADKAQGSVSPAFTAITNIVINSNAAADFTANQTNVNFVINAPANFQFQAGAGTVSGAGTITGTSIVVTATTITVTYSSGAANVANALTISGLQVQGTVKIPISSITFTRAAGGSSTISGFTSGTVAGTLSQVAGTAVKLQTLLPGETAAPATASGKTGTPTAQTGAIAYNVIVNAVDANWNVNTAITDNIAITSSDASAVLPVNAVLVAGTKTFSVKPITLGAQTVTATDVTDAAKTAGTSASVTVSAGAFTKMQLLLPGETASPGSGSGKTGTPTAPVAGTPFNVTVNAVDANWYVVTSATDVAGITSTDANAVLPANAALVSGSQTFTITLKTAGSRTITASDITTPAKTPNTSPSLTVAAGTFVKLQLLLPGETAAPGTATGKTGTPNAQTGATNITITVNAVDANWNVVTSADVVNITSSDAAATLPASAALSAGTKTYTIKLNTLGSQTITATDVTNGVITASTSPSVAVSAGAFTKMQILLPGETAAPGTTTGKTGTPTVPVPGTAFNVTVNAVDANWYVITSATDVAGITSSDANAVLPANAALAAGTQTFSVTLRTAGTRTVTASDITTPAKTANASPSLTVVAGPFVKLQLLMPGESASAGSATGKTGSPSARAAGTAFNIIVNAVDVAWNKVTSITHTVGITTNDANALPVANTAMASGTKTISVTLKTPTTTALVTATDITDGTKTASTSPNTVVNIGAFTKLQLLMPGETAAPGTTTGKTGTPNGQTAGASFNVTVNAVDAAWNVVPSVTDVVKLTSTDVNAVLPANTALASGTQTLSVTFKTSGNKTVTASDVTTPARTANTSPTVLVATGAFVKLQLLLPGETASPGSATGKTGTPSARTAGVSFSVTVNAVDANWNKVTTVTDNVGITSTDALGTMPANAALAAGTKTNFTVTLKTPGTPTVTATDITNGSKTANTSPAVTVSTGAFAKLQLLLPGETAAPGTGSGKTGTPTAPVAGTAFNVTVNAVDAVWNLIPSATDVVKITATDINAVLPANASLVSGTKTFSVTLKTAGARTLTATDVTNGAITTNTSPSVTVATNTYSNLQILLPGETAAPGTATGATGTANPPARSTAFNITVNAVDAYFNIVTSVTNTVTITSNDGTAVLPAPAAMVAGTKTFNVNIKSVSTSPLPTLTATDAGISKTVNVPVGIAATAATDYFRTKASGNWNDASIWQSSVNGTTNWQDATLTPTSTAAVVTVQNGNTAAVTANVTVDQVVVEAGAQVNVNSGVTLTITGSGTQFDVSGILNNAGTVTTTGALVFESGSRYQHNFSTAAGTIPTATWNTLSVCEITGYTSFTGTMAGTNQSFGNFVWNCPGQNVGGGVFLAASGTTSVHDLTITSTGTGNFKLGNSASTSTINVTGDFLLSAGTLVTNNSTGTTNLNISGNFTQTGGSLQRNNGTANIAFTGTSTQNYVKSGGTISGTVNFAINTNAIVDFDIYLLDGSGGTFTLNTGGTIITGNDAGLALTGSTGSIQVSGTRTYSTTANYTYNGTNAQSIGTGLPATINNFTLDNTQGATMPAGTASYTINGVLALTNGDLDMGTNNLISGAGFSTSGTGTLMTQSISSTPLTAGKTWTIPVEYYSSVPQTVVTGIFSDLSFSSNGTKTATAGSITVNGNWNSSDGKVDLLTNSTTVLFSGTTQALDDDGTDNGTGIVFKNVTFGNSGTKTLNTGSYAIATTSLLTMSGSAVLAANGNLTVKSDAASSGNIGPLTGSADITGNVNVESFLTGGNLDINRGTRSMSTPINDAGLTTKTYQQLQSYMLITGPGNVANGFDLGGTGVPNSVTIQTYNEPPYTAGIYTPVPNIAAPATPGTGFFLFFRGDRSNPSGKLNQPFDSPEDVTVTYSGPLNKGNVTLSGLTNTHNAGDPVNGYNLVGNPYASAIDWSTVLSNSTNMDDLVVVVKAGGGTATYIGGFSANGGSRYIQTGQGFYVKVLDAANTGIIKFTESSKVVNSPARLLSLPGNIRQLANTEPVTKVLRMSLEDGLSADETVVVFKAGYSETSKDDAPYFIGNTVSMGTLASDGRNLAINLMPDLSTISQLKLSVNSTSSNNVTLRFTDVAAIEGYQAVLKDNYLRTSVIVNKNTVYSFAIDKTIAATFGTDRLVIEFAKLPPVLPFKLLSFAAEKTIPGSSLTWLAKYETTNDRFEIERGNDTLSFGRIATIQSLHDTTKNTYSYVDKSPLKGVNYYRLKQINADATFSYSGIRNVDYSELLASPKLIAYPNPAVNRISINYKDFGNKALQITIYNNQGRQVAAGSVNAVNGIITQSVFTLPQGVYIIGVFEPATSHIMGMAKFIKE